MHKHHSSEPGYYRGWLHIGLPENPICWLLGHRPRPVVTDWKYDTTPSLWIDCTVCGRRYTDPDEARRFRELDKAGRDDLHARRVYRAREDPAAFVTGVHRRIGWAERTLELHNDVHWPSRKAGARRRARGGGLDAAVRFHVGDRGSETPFDGHLTAGPFGYYWSIGGVGHRLAAALGRGHKRDLSLSVHGGQLWWKVWHDDAHRCDSWRRPKVWPWSAGRKKHRGWMCLRDGNLDLNPLDAIWGHRFYEYESLETATVAVPVDEFPGDTYLVELTLQRQRRRRRNGPAWVRRVVSDEFAVEFDTRGLCNGIPFRNHSWKGDETLAGGVRVPELDGFNPAKGWGDLDWQAAAVRALVDDTKGRRRRYRYSPPAPAAS